MARLFAISDLHLSLARPGEKSMSRFGSQWDGHPELLFERWQQTIGDYDWVLVPGDISWARREDELAVDYERIDRLPGRKLFSPGNHDYGPWKTQNKITRFVEPYATITALKRGALRLGAGDGPGVVVAAAKGSLSTEDEIYGGEWNERAGTEAARKRFLRELGRFRFALREAEQLRRDGDLLVACLHYPPFANLRQPNAFTRLLCEFGADACLFGHLHRPEEHRDVISGELDGVRYKLVGCDALAMTPALVAELDPKPRLAL